ncbi:hypothetical protein LR032_03525 [Candidatus Bipolaricaulota bacterium]|nr:hypothetical protein [Candidatus Bipolaricaulota bacterium]
MMVRNVKRYLFFVILLLALAGMTAVTIPLCEYISHRTDISDLRINFAYRYHNDPYGLRGRDIDEGELFIDFTRRFDSPDFGFNIAVTTDMRISTVALSSFSVIAEGDLKRYFAAGAPHFGVAGVRAKTSSAYETIGLFVRLGIGYGRFTDVTPLAKALKINAHLLEQEAISEHLARIDLLSIAHEIDNIDTYETLADLLTVLRQIIEGSGLVRIGGLDALNIYEMARIIEDDRHPRFCGGNVSVGIGYEILDPMKGRNDILATAVFNYALITTPQAQLLISGSFSGAYDFLATHQIRITAAYDYIISDIVSLSALHSFSRETRGGLPTDKHDLAIDLMLTPVEGAYVALGMRFAHRPWFLELRKDITFRIGMDLL